jgi:dTDP-glucose 4,6-dehydratase
MKIAVTGCAGFIGANFVNYWLDKYPADTVVGIDCLTYAANLAALAKLKERPNFVFYPYNICDRDAMESIFAREACEVIVNFAAESHVDRSIDDSEVFIKTNVLGTGVLLDMAQRYGVRRFHQISTDEVYGDLPLDSDILFTEASALKPSSPYSASKAAADMLALSYHRTHGLSVTVSRCANNYGIYQHVEKLIPKTVHYAIRREIFPIYGDGMNVREWIHVVDHIAAVDAIIRHGTAGEVYNVGTGKLIRNIDLVERILEYLGASRDMIAYTSDRKGHDLKYALDSTKIRSELGWHPCRDLDADLPEIIDWYAANPPQ